MLLVRFDTRVKRAVKGIFVNRELLVLLPVNCEITFLFLVKRDFGNCREEGFLVLIIFETRIGCWIHRKLWQWSATRSWKKRWIFIWNFWNTPAPWIRWQLPWSQWLEEDGAEPQLRNKELGPAFSQHQEQEAGEWWGHRTRQFLTKVRKTYRIRTFFFSWNVKCRIYCPWNVKRPFNFPWNVVNTPQPPFTTLSERQRERENWELSRPEAGVETDLEITQSNCGESPWKVTPNRGSSLHWTIPQVSAYSLLLFFLLVNHRYGCVICSLEVLLFLRLKTRNKFDGSMQSSRIMWSGL